MTDKARLFDAALLGWPRAVGGVETDNPVWLAPMAGITFATFRQFHRAMGAGLVHTEMVSALGLRYKGRKTRELLCGEDESPCALQLFGAEAEDIRLGAEIALNTRRFEALEVNMACPMPKVTKKGAGSKLLADHKKAAAMMSALKGFGLPVWAKVRIMPEGAPLSTEEFCEALFEAGADFIFVHGRTPAQRYEGIASRGAVEAAAKRFPGLIGGSGDCYSPEDFADYLSRGCAAVLAGRGLLRDALIVPQTLARLGCQVPEKYLSPTPGQQAALVLELGRRIYAAEGEGLALTIARRMLGALFKGFAGASQLRRAGAMVKSWPEMELLLSEHAGLAGEADRVYTV